MLGTTLMLRLIGPMLQTSLHDLMVDLLQTVLLQHGTTLLLVGSTREHMVGLAEDHHTVVVVAVVAALLVDLAMANGKMADTFQALQTHA